MCYNHKMKEFNENGFTVNINENKANEFNKNFTLAEKIIPVQNKYLSKEQTTYCLGWKNLVNKKSEPCNVMYNAMGPDIATALLTTNATSIYGIEFSPPETKKLKYYLDNWNKVDTDVTSLPPENNLYQDKYNENSNVITQNEATEFANKEIQNTLQKRNERGYWDVKEMYTWSIERCLIIEMKKLGINPESIKIDESKGRTQIEFDFAFPGENTKARKVIYIADYTFDILENPELHNIPLLDVYYEKSKETAETDGMRKKELQDLQTFIKPGGSMLFGRSIGAKEEENIRENKDRNSLKDNFSNLSIDDNYTTMMTKFMKEKRHNYGWELYGLQKFDANN